LASAPAGAVAASPFAAFPCAGAPADALVFVGCVPAAGAGADVGGGF
jgi:hypothetical protein